MISLPLKCLIVEDEPLAAEVLGDYIAQTPQLMLVGTCTDALYAMEALRTKDIDVMFLDIHLPKLKGLDFLKVLDNPPQVIITTAYHQYALEGYEHNVVDYLLKPIEFSRFLQAVNKLGPKLEKEKKEEINSSSTDSIEDYRFFTVNKRQVKIYFHEIQYIESLKEYVRIVTKDKEIVTKYQIGALHDTLDQRKFIRIHRSFIIAKDKITAYSSNEIEIGSKVLPIGRSYQRTVLSILNAMKEN